MNSPPLRPPAERFAGIMEGVYQALAAQGLRGALMGPLLILVCSKLRRTAARILLIAAKLQAGTLRLRPPRERAVQSREAPAEPAKPTKLLLPLAFGWLPRLVREVNFGRSQLAHLLSEPDMVALIAAAPPIAHHLRRICRMLGVKPPPGLFPQRRRRSVEPAQAPQAARPEEKKPARQKPQSPRSRPFPSIAPPKRKRRKAPSRKPPAFLACGPPWLG